MPSVASSTISTPLSAFASGYQNSDFIGDKLCPVIYHDNPKGTYFAKSRVDVSDVYSDLTGANSEPSTVDESLSQTSFTVSARSLMGYVSYSVIDAALDPLKPKESRAKNVMQRLALAQEYRVATLLLASGSYAAANTAAATAAWSNHATSKPILDIQNAVAAIAPNDPGESKLVMGMGLETWQALSRHPDILSLRAGGGSVGGVAKPSEIAEHLGVDEIHVSKVQYNTAARGATASYSRVWTTTKCVILNVPKTAPSADDNAAVHSCQFRWNGPNQMPFEALEFDDPKRGPGKGSVGIKISHWTVEGVVQNDMGFLLTSVL